MARYARHLSLEGWDQDVISSSHVLIVGIGALGCEIAKNLALVGVGNLILIDMDTIETSNLSRQMLFTDNDRGRLKAEVAKEKLKILNPDVSIETYTQKFQDLPMSVFEGVDLIAGGLDSFSARFALNRLAHELCKPYVDGAATGFKGNVQVIIPEGDPLLKDATPCLRCFFPIPPADEKVYVACSIPGEPRSREQCILKAEDEFVKEHGIHKEYSDKELDMIAKIASRLSKESPHTKAEEFMPHEVENIIENKIPSILTVNAVISAIVSHEVLKILHRLSGLNIGEIMSPSYLEYSSSYGIFTPVEISKDENCAVCGKERVKLSLKMKSDSTFADMLSSLKKEGVDLKETVLITKIIDGSVIAAPGQDIMGSRLSDLPIQNRDILRATYTSVDENGKLKREQAEFIIEMEG
ncbi:MAG: ThiF family adenylyltransferase [Thermoplasmata archaeon]|nr:MAG: ThiF family adenylyltransferase [Thermoplasmata archaeon]